MNKINEYIHSKRNEDLRNCVMETALFIEENTGILFTDSELSPDILGTVESIRKTVFEKLSTQ